MCGIIGYVGSEEAFPLISEGLKKLEYRGYDSAGLATIAEKLFVLKDVGTVSELVSEMGVMPGKIGVAHTRWATHGGVTKENSHPHVCSNSVIAVVHNGIIENYVELRKELQASGCVFSSQTDSEVIPHLVSSFYEGNLEKAVMNAVKKIDGSFAFLVVSSKEPDKIVAVRKESPLVVGVANHGVFFSSDVTPLAGKVDKVFFMDDCELAVAKEGRVDFYHYLSGAPILKESSPLLLSESSTSLQGHEHYMLKEILEQPVSLRKALMQDFAKIERMAARIASAKKVFFVACGSSFYASLVGKNLFARAGKQVEVVIGSEFAYSLDLVNEETVILAVSQSGETADVMEPVKRAKAKGAVIYSIVNTVGSSLDRLSEESLYLNCGPEIGVASTKSFSSQLCLFYLLSHAAVGTALHAKQELEELSELLEDHLKYWSEAAKDLAEKIVLHKDAYVIGRGVNYPIALEGALKLKEISYIHAEGMASGELKHGTIALISKGVPVIVLNPLDYSFKDSLGNGLETKARGAFLVGVSNEENPAYDYFIKLPRVSEEFYALVELMPLQFLAYYSAVKLGLNPDRPRNLAKSVTVK